MKIIIPKIFADFAKIKYKGKSIYALENLPFFTYNTPYPNYILYEEQENNFIPVLKDFTLYDIKMEKMLIPTSLGQTYIQIPELSQTIEEPEQITKYFSQQVNEIIDKIYAYLRLVQSTLNIISVSLTFSNAYLFENEILFCPKVNREIHKNFKEVTVIEKSLVDTDPIYIQKIFEALEIPKAIDSLGKVKYYIPYPLFDLEKIKEDFSFSKKNLEQFLNQNERLLYKNASKIRENEDIEIRKITHHSTIWNKETTITTKCEKHKEVITPEYKELLGIEPPLIERPDGPFARPIYYFPSQIMECSSLYFFDKSIVDTENLYEISFTAEIPNEFDKNQILYKLQLHMDKTGKIKSRDFYIKGKKYEITKNEKNASTIKYRYNNVTHEIQTTVYVPENFMQDLDLDLSLKIIDTICHS